MLKRFRWNFLLSLLLILVLFNSASAQSKKKMLQAILIDNTGSLRGQFPDVVELGKGIVEQIHLRGPLSLFGFQSQGDERKQRAVIAPGIEWSQDRNVLENYIDSLSIAPGQTSLMDAINSIAEQINKRTNLDKEIYGDKFIYLITDGEDRVSKVKEKQLLNILKDNGITVYAVGLLQNLDEEGGTVRRSQREKAEEFLKRITKGTGGRVVFSKSKKDTVEGLLNALFAK